MEAPDKVGRALARPEKCHIRKGVEIYLKIQEKLWQERCSLMLRRAKNAE